MKISTEIYSSARHIGEEKAIELLAKAGFDCWDFSMFEMARIDWSTYQLKESNHPLAKPNYVDFAKKLKKVADDCGIECNQSHAPFPTRAVGLDNIRRAIECTDIAGGKICVVHPDNNFTAEQNAEIFNELLPFAKEHNVKIATENMWNWKANAPRGCPAACSLAEDFKKHIDIIDDDFFVACLDIGHAEMRGSGSGAVNMIKTLGHRLQALHIHDNDQWRDRHGLPFSMNIDFNAVVKALKEIDYKGYFTLEADSFLMDYTQENVFDGVVKMQESARKLADMFEQL
jgi:sugar phosphate isomerase/epimerase